MPKRDTKPKPTVAAPATPARSTLALRPAPAGHPSLHTYLRSFDIEVPSVASRVVPGGPNTRSRHEYRYTDIKRDALQPWAEFSRSACLARFADALHATRVAEQPAYVSPQKGIASKEFACEAEVADFLRRSLTLHLNRALAAAPGCELQDCGGANVGCSADRVGIVFPAREIRLVGDVKVSWKWRSEWRDAPRSSTQNLEYRQVLSQLNYYMNRDNCRWGYVVTDREFVALQRGPEFGALKVAEAVRLEGGDRDWGVALAAWHLHMMAALDGGEWSLPKSTKAGRGALTRSTVAGINEVTKEEKEVQVQEAAVPRRRSPRLAAKAAAEGV
ncbi:hypothetical protein FN846DRAFT_903465 [Sphaerosporella brunnea]|uniref:Uncharacterized protein n=1 Tax=Sphaerosporella brunnea TaxID=1250544 RepID=A0A5J5F716_9PEZI|nr:hypothetical protein FN846DRAFT_903465 [Sphaerosporella brunnea]